MKEGEEIDCLVEEYGGEDMDNFEIFVDVDLRIQFHHFNYDEDEFSKIDCSFDSSSDCMYSLEYVDDIVYAMDMAIQKIYEEIDELKDKGKILGIDNFRILLIIRTPI